MERLEEETHSTEINPDIIIRKVAEVEIVEAFVWYEKQQKGLGFEFLNSTDEAMKSVKTNPGSYQLIHKNIRRVLLRKFPYALFYILENDKITILGCFHQRRHQDEWIGRMSDE